MINVNYATAKEIIGSLEMKNLIMIHPVAKKKRICYKITAKGADIYQKAREIYHSLDMDISESAHKL